MTNLEKAFSKMKADVQIKKGDRVVSRQTRRGRVFRTLPGGDNYTVDVKNGKFIFDLGNSDTTVTVQEADPKDKHILVNVRRKVQVENRAKDGFHTEIQNDKWLCGHDERDWFVAAATGTTIWEAKQNLKPKEVREVEGGVERKKLHKRKNSAFLRQGEWFFVPSPDFKLPKNSVTHRDEPMSRPGGGKPHIVEEVYRSGGRTVWFNGTNVLTPSEYRKLDPSLKVGYTQRQADASVYGRGYVKHPDHATIHLEGWHRIYMNTENRSRNGSVMVFID